MKKSKKCETDDILRKLRRSIRRHVVITGVQATSLALWLCHAWLLDCFPFSPRLCLASPERGCGKSTVLELLSLLVPRPLFITSASAAAIFHSIEGQRPTLLFDEGDLPLKDNEILGVLNTGFRRAGAHVLRAGRGGVIKYATWCPAAFAVLDSVPDTLTSRSITLLLRKKRPDECVTRLEGRPRRQVVKLAKRLKRWAQSAGNEIAKSDPKLPVGIDNRDADVWRPLLQIAEAAGPIWQRRAARAARKLARLEARAVGTELLADIKSIMDRRGDKVFSADLAADLAKIDDRPWGSFLGRGAITPAAIAAELSRYGVKPLNIRDGSRVRRGYRRAQFDDAFARYLT